MIALTTGRQTSQRLNILLKDLAHTIPKSKILRRGKSSLDEVFRRALENGLNRALILQRWHGAPGRIDLYEVLPSGTGKLVLSATVRSARLRRECGTRGGSYASSISIASHERSPADRFSRVLSKFTELPILDSSLAGRDSFHVSLNAKGEVQIGLLSSSETRETGLQLRLSKISWTSNEEET